MFVNLKINPLYYLKIKGESAPSYNNAEPTISLSPTRSLPMQSSAETKLKFFHSTHESDEINNLVDHERNKALNEMSQENDFEEEVVPIFTFRKYNNKRGNYSSRGRTATINWPWFGKKHLFLVFA